ncbi:hypothetical protein THIOKS11020011 [Thiocapsa sp. KS1]|nr:hypothetical protein [Thiocapsa sp. KS1]CRI62875.1 hypothetical protein THIOKS11020011 [Thiocapsa sp. KS1]
MKHETPTDPIAAMIQAMFSGGCTEEQIAAAKDAARSAKFAGVSDAELEAMIAEQAPWMSKLTDAEIEAVHEALCADADADALLAIVGDNPALTDEDLAEIRAFGAEE